MVSDKPVSTESPKKPSPICTAYDSAADLAAEDSSSAGSSLRSSLSFPPPRDSTVPSPSVSHRTSFVEQQRNYPPSPRTRRQPSYSSVALSELMMQPTVRSAGSSDTRFHGREWRHVKVYEIIEPAETRFVELETSIEETTKLLVKSGAPNVVLIRESRRTKTPIGTFDYSDLNAYLLLVLGLVQPDDLATSLADRARNGEAIPLVDILDHLGPREQPAFLPHTATLDAAMELLGGGLHRIVVCKEGTSEALGILSQLRLVRFFWENHQNFTQLERLYTQSLKGLDVGTKNVLAMNGDRPVSDALLLMHGEGVTSLPVLDNHRNVIGNISHVDVRLLTDTSAIPLLSSSCIHFISVILSERGMIDGKDSFPVFHVAPYNTLAHTVAKLCATRSHRMWIVDAPSPSSSVPPSPGLSAAVPPFHQTLHSRQSSLHEPTPGPPFTSTNPAVSVGAGQLPGAGMSGRLSGVISLTDVLNLLARASGLFPTDPEETRRRRRRSSSSSTRPMMENMRASGEMIRNSLDVRRTPSVSSRRGP